MTRNSVDFRGAASRPSEKGNMPVSICMPAWSALNGPEGMTRALQLELFEQALLELDADPDLVNQVLEVTLEDDDHLRVIRCALPSEPDQRT